MKTKSFIAFYACILPCIIYSCTNDDENNGIESNSQLEKYPKEIIKIPVGNEGDFANWINSDKQSPLYYLGDSIWSNGKGRSLIYESDEIVVLEKWANQIYPGALLKGGSIETGRYVPLSNKVDPITISCSFPAKWASAQIQRPSLSSFRNTVSQIMNNNGMSGTQLSSFSYELTQFTYIDELKLSFGSNISIKEIFDVDVNYNKGKITRKSGLIVKFIQKNFTVDMDLPEDGNLLANNAELNSIDKYSPLYISSVTYGRIGIITMDSYSSIDSVRMAVNASFNSKVINGSVELDKKYKTIIENAKTKIFTKGGKGEDIVQSVDGYVKFHDFIKQGGKFTPQEPGLPIAFSASYLVDNSPYYTTFKVDIQD